MQEVVDKFSRPSELVVDLFFPILATEKRCSKLLQHHSFLRCKVDIEFFATRAKALAETYAKLALKKKSDIFSTDEVVHASKITI